MQHSVGKLLGHPAARLKYAPDDSLVLPDCAIGVEFEFEGVSTKAAAAAIEHSPRWVTHEDGSLRNNGMEFVFREPLFGKDAVEAVTELMAEAARNKFQCTVRTGLHVHVDCRDLLPTQFKSMCMAYALLEPILYKWVGDDREESTFCVPWYYADDALKCTTQIINSLVSETDLVRPGIKTNKSHVVVADYRRYAGLNLASLNKFGSVEYRQMKTTLDVKRTFNWINICLSIKRAGMKSTPEDLFKLAKAYGLAGVSESILGHNLTQEVIGRVGYHEARELMTMGMETASVLMKETTSVTPGGQFSSRIIKRWAGDNPALKKFLAKKAGARRPVPEQQFPEGDARIAPGGRWADPALGAYAAPPGRLDLNEFYQRMGMVAPTPADPQATIRVNTPRGRR